MMPPGRFSGEVVTGRRCWGRARSGARTGGLVLGTNGSTHIVQRRRSLLWSGDAAEARLFV